MADIQIVPSANGPNLVTGALELRWPSGHAIETTGKADKNGVISLCRCGHSNDKPFCDGSHARVGFKSVEGDETAHRDA